MHTGFVNQVCLRYKCVDFSVYLMVAVFYWPEYTLVTKMVNI